MGTENQHDQEPGSLPAVGDIVELPLPDGRYAYGRVLRDASVAVLISETSVIPPVGTRDYECVVGVDEGDLARLAVVGHDPAIDEADEWPPPYSVTDPITGESRIYHRGEIRPHQSADATGLEPAAVWSVEQIVERALTSES
jgi:hypothetical protein